MTLLEVILAITILGGALAVLGELARVGTRASRAATTLSTAQLLADSLMAEICSSATTPTSMQGVVEDYGGSDWNYSVDVQTIDEQGLLALLVTVQEQLDPEQRPVTFSLSRWLVDPQLEADLEAAEQEMQGEESSDSQSGQDEAGNDAATSGANGAAAPASGGTSGGAVPTGGAGSAGGGAVLGGGRG